MASVLLAIPTFVSGQELGALWPLILAGAITPGASQILFVQSVRDIGPSRTAILVGVSPLLSVTIALIALGEPFRYEVAVGAVLIVGGGAVLASERGRPDHFRALGVVLALCCALLFALRDNVVRLFARDDRIPAFAGAAVILLAALAVVAIYLVLRRPRGLVKSFRTAVPAFLLPGVLLAAAIASLLEAFNRGRVSVVAPINATQSLWATCLALILLRSSDAIGKRTLLAALLVLAGGVMVGTSR